MGRLKGFIGSTIQENIQALYILSSLFQNDFLRLRRIIYSVFRLKEVCELDQNEEHFPCVDI